MGINKKISEKAIKYPKYEKQRDKYLKAITKRAHPPKIQDVESVNTENKKSFLIKVIRVDGSKATHGNDFGMFGFEEWKQMYLILCKKPNLHARDTGMRMFMERIKEKASIEAEIELLPWVTPSNLNDPNNIITSPQKPELKRKALEKQLMIEGLKSISYPSLNSSIFLRNVFQKWRCSENTRICSYILTIKEERLRNSKE